MKGVGYYYGEFRRILNSENPRLAREFEEFVNTNPQPNEVFMWLEEKRRDGLLPHKMDSYLTDFFWEIR